MKIDKIDWIGHPVIFRSNLKWSLGTLVSPAMGHWGTCPPLLPNLIFLVTAEPHKLRVSDTGLYLVA